MNPSTLILWAINEGKQLSLNFLVLLPLFIMVVLLVRQKHMMVAGIAGAAVAMILGPIGFQRAGNIIMSTLPVMLSIVVPVLYSATALTLAKLGCFDALLGLSRRIIGTKRIYLLAPVIVLIQALATYAAGMGAGNTMVTGPLAFAVLGAIPQMVAAMAIATAASFVTSPSSAESTALTKIAGTDVATYTTMMFPFTVSLWLIAMLLAAYGVYKKGSIFKQQTQSELPWNTVILKSIPPIYFIVVVVAGKYLNQLIGYPLFAPPFNMISTLVIAIVLTRATMNKVSENLIENSAFILTRLFSIGLFLGFINILAEIGTFRYIAGLVSAVPSFVYVPAAILTAFAIAIPSGAYSVGVITLIMPVLAASGLSLMQMGLAALAIGLGTQMSPVQINVAALSQTFKLDIPQVVRNNAPYVFILMIVLCALGFFL